MPGTIASGIATVPYPVLLDTDLNIINQDGYSAEYLNVGALVSHRLFVRHSTEKPKSSGLVYDRHSIDLTMKTFATATASERDHQAYLVIRSLQNSDVANAKDVAGGLRDLLTSDVLDMMLSWQST